VQRKSWVGAAQASNEVVFPDADGSLGGICARDIVNSRTGTRASMCAPKRAPPRGTPRHKPRANRYVNYSIAEQRSPL
jgi:hypothetical protein